METFRPLHYIIIIIIVIVMVSIIYLLLRTPENPKSNSRSNIQSTNIDLSNDIELSDISKSDLSDTSLTLPSELTSSDVSDDTTIDTIISNYDIDDTNQSDPPNYNFDYEIKSSEEHCRHIFEELFAMPFPKKRVDFIINTETNRKLELDGICEQLKLAFEFNGEQHYKTPNFFHGNDREKFIAQVRRDQFKIVMCNKVGIDLIIIPYTINKNERRQYIIDHIPQQLKNMIK